MAPWDWEQVDRIETVTAKRERTRYKPGQKRASGVTLARFNFRLGKWINVTTYPCVAGADGFRKLASMVAASSWLTRSNANAALAKLGSPHWRWRRCGVETKLEKRCEPARWPNAHARTYRVLPNAQR